MVFKHADITDLIIKAFYRVYGGLGYGFLEKVYRNSMAIELRKVGLLFNFGPKPEIKRKAFDNARKGSMRWFEKQ
jgi:GxxExxY protein